MRGIFSSTISKDGDGRVVEVLLPELQFSSLFSPPTTSSSRVNSSRLPLPADD